MASKLLRACIDDGGKPQSFHERKQSLTSAIASKLDACHPRCADRGLLPSVLCLPRLAACQIAADLFRKVEVEVGDKHLSRFRPNQVFLFKGMKVKLPWRLPLHGPGRIVQVRQAERRK
jgi:hypothetical protein